VIAFAIAILLALAVLLVFVAVRNGAVLQSRLAILDVKPISKGLDLHNALPSYEAMLFHPKYWLLWTAPHWLAWVGRRGRTA
jgi:hypothetical protein